MNGIILYFKLRSSTIISVDTDSWILFSQLATVDHIFEVYLIFRNGGFTSEILEI